MNETVRFILTLVAAIGLTVGGAFVAAIALTKTPEYREQYKFYGVRDLNRIDYREAKH